MVAPLTELDSTTRKRLKSRPIPFVGYSVLRLGTTISHCLDLAISPQGKQLLMGDKEISQGL